MKKEDFFTGEIQAGEMKLIDKQNHEFIAYRKVLLQISHDLRTPAAVLKSNFQLLNKFHYDLDKETKEENLRICQSALENIISFLDKIQLLNISLHSNLKPFYTQFKAKTLLDKLFEYEELKPNYRRIKSYWNLKNPIIFSDYGFLQQILFHLLSNALKFSVGDVDLYISNITENIIILVKDSGIGIPPMEQELVFNPFYRASNACSFAGGGMGLTMVRALVNNLGGELYLSSKIGNGTVLKIAFKNFSRDIN